MTADRRKTDSAGENHTCERDYCALHETQEKAIEDVKRETRSKVAWVVFSCILGILLISIGGSYKYTDRCNDALKAEVKEANERQDKVISEGRAETREDLKDIKNMLQAIADRRR